VGVVGIGRIASAWIPAAAYWDAPLAMTYTTVLGGMLAKFSRTLSSSRPERVSHSRLTSRPRTFP